MKWLGIFLVLCMVLFGANVLTAFIFGTGPFEHKDERRTEARLDSTLGNTSIGYQAAYGSTQAYGTKSITSGDYSTATLLRSYLDSVEEKRESDSVRRRWGRRGYNVTLQDCQPFWDRALSPGRVRVFYGAPIPLIEKDTVTITGIDRNTTITSDTQSRVIQWIGGNRFVIWESRFPQ